MKSKKEGRYLNIYADDKMLTAFEQIALVEGKTKTRLMEESMARTIKAYCMKHGLDDLPVTKEPAKCGENDCYVIRECAARGSSTCVILKHDGTLEEVSRKTVEVIINE